MVQNHLVVAGLGHPEAIGQRACPLGIACADRDHADAVQLASRLHDRPLGDARGTQDPDAKRLLGHRLILSGHRPSPGSGYRATRTSTIGRSTFCTYHPLTIALSAGRGL